MSAGDSSPARSQAAMTIAEGVDRPTLPAETLERVRRTRRHPQITQFDYLHLKRLVDDLAEALASIPQPVEDVLDVLCGTRPYEDMLPAGARCTGIDIDNHYGSADLTTHAFLPFDDGSFDLVLCISGFHYLPDPRRGAEEIRRVLRPGGTVLITVPVVWEYDRTIPEQRFTGPELEALFASWEDVEVVENGGRAVSWALLTGHLLYLRERALRRRVRTLAAPLFKLAYLTINALGALADRGMRSRDAGPYTLPANLLLRARKPIG
jgi:SAM-dependent methyltransferase